MYTNYERTYKCGSLMSTLVYKCISYIHTSVYKCRNIAHPRLPVSVSDGSSPLFNISAAAHNYKRDKCVCVCHSNITYLYKRDEKNIAVGMMEALKIVTE